MAAFVSSEGFCNLSSEICQLLYCRTGGDRNILTKTLDDLNTLNYKCHLSINSTKAVLLLNQCCSFIPTDDEVLVQKCSTLVLNLVKFQGIIIEGKTLHICVQWCLESLKVKDKRIISDILQALDCLLRSSPDNVYLFMDAVIKEVTSLITEENNTKAPHIILHVLLALEACTYMPSNPRSKKWDDLNCKYEMCADIFCKYLCSTHQFNGIVLCQIIKVCLNGLQNIVMQNKEYTSKNLGHLLGIVKTYMLFEMNGIDFFLPQKILPSTMSVLETPVNTFREKKGGKVTKQRKQRSSLDTKRKEPKSANEEIRNFERAGYIPANTSLACDNLESSDLSKVKTSDSDFSDSEGGNLAKLRQNSAKVRQAALSLLYHIIKNTEKSTLFGYWSNFVPQDISSEKHNLLTCVLRDSSARNRMAALNVLLVLLTTCKMYLAQAETSNKLTSFTPFSVTLGLTLTELHRGLSRALSEQSVPVLTQVLKCIAALVQSTPYHRMTPGLVTKIARNVKSLIYHKDASVQVTSLIIMGCILASEPVVPETEQIMLKLQKENDVKEVQKDVSNLDINDFEYAEFSSEDESDVNIDNSDVPWLLRRCLSNLGVTFGETDETKVVPAPVKLESLQVISAISRNYFESIMAKHLPFITRALDMSLSDRYTDLRLHAGRAVDFIGQAMNKYLSTEDKSTVALSSYITLWQTLLNGSLISLLQNEHHPILRAVGCDCIGSIGPQVFEQLPRDKQLLCVTLLFSCARDEENSVKGAAVRALAICVLYPSLRADTGFVMDTAEAILRALKDESVMVRVKGSWSLGNLSDALVLNSKNSDNVEELTESLLLKLINAGISCANDNDKLKMNAARALGNLLQLIDDLIIKKPEFFDVVGKAMDVLVKNSTSGSNMKVRWNACYAIGSALKISALYENTTWKAYVFTSLMNLVMDFHNFKVRINAALALSSPPRRDLYGQHFLPVFTALLKALENSQNMEDFTEYKHRDNLVEQICLSLGHLTNLVTPEDLMPLEDTIILYHETFQSHMHKVLERLIPEKSTVLFEAMSNLKKLESQAELSAEQNNVIKLMKDIYYSDFNC